MGRGLASVLLFAFPGAWRDQVGPVGDRKHKQVFRRGGRVLVVKLWVPWGSSGRRRRRRAVVEGVEPRLVLAGTQLPASEMNCCDEVPDPSLPFAQSHSHCLAFDPVEKSFRENDAFTRNLGKAVKLDPKGAHQLVLPDREHPPTIYVALSYRGS